MAFFDDDQMLLDIIWFSGQAIDTRDPHAFPGTPEFCSPG